MNNIIRLLGILILFFFISCSTNEQKPDGHITSSRIEDDETKTSHEQDLIPGHSEELDSSLFKIFKNIPYVNLKKRFQQVETSSIIAKREKWRIPNESGNLFSVNWPDTSMIQLSRRGCVNEAIVFNPTKGWKQPEKDELLQLSIVSHDIGVGLFFNGQKKYSLPLSDFQKFNDTIFFKRDGLGTLLILGFSKEDVLKYFRIGSYDQDWLDDNIEQELDTFLFDFLRRVPCP